MVWTEVITGLFAIGIVTASVIAIVKLTKSTKGLEAKPNLPMCTNWARREFSDGHTHGLIKKAVLRKNGCYYVEMIPTDIDQLDKKNLPEIQSFIVHKDYFISMARGEGSSRREEVLFAAITKDNLPEVMQESLEADFLSAKGQVAFVKKTFGIGIKNGHEAIVTLTRDYALGEISKDTYEHEKEVTKKARESREGTHEIEKKEE